MRGNRGLLDGYIPMAYLIFLGGRQIIMLPGLPARLAVFAVR